MPIQLWEKKILLGTDKKISVSETCCCPTCPWPDCCPFFESQYNQLLVKFNSCGPEVCTGSPTVVNSIYGMNFDLGGYWLADSATYSSGEPLVGTSWSLKLWCLDEGETGLPTSFRVTFAMTPGVECCDDAMSFTWDFTQNCVVFSYSDTADWSGTPYYCPDWYSGCMSFEIYRAPCSGPPDGCNCTFDYICTPQSLVATIVATGVCDDLTELNGTSVLLECVGGCRWETDGAACFDVPDNCCYTLVLTGGDEHNRYCTFRLEIFDEGDALIYSELATSGGNNPFTLSFTNISLPCCEGEILEIIITLAP